MLKQNKCNILHSLAESAIFGWEQSIPTDFILAHGDSILFM